ncbi:MAG: undecaprenyl-phosphate glucose phosphotransferase [Pseudomonadota bacterium]
MSTVFSVPRAAARPRRGPRALRPAAILALTLRGADLCTIAVTAWLAELLFGLGSLTSSEKLFMGVTLLLASSAFGAFRLYDVERLTTPLEQLPRVCLAWLGILAGAILVVFVLRPEELPSHQWVLTWLITGVLGLTMGRICAKAWVSHLQLTGDIGWNVVVVGSGDWGPKAHRRLDSDRLHARVIGYVDLDQFANPNDAMLELRRQLAGRPVDQVALALAPRDAVRTADFLGALRDFPVEVGVVPQPVPGPVTVIGSRRLGDLTTLTYTEKPIDGWAWHLKSAFDAVAAGVMLLFLSPLLAIIALAVKTTSPGPVFYRQKRLGFNQQPIDVFKFRSMYVDLCDAPTAKSVRQATRDDPRVTPVGRWLRKTSLDELPQLLNVLRGEMSLVGPRPHAIAHDEYYATLIDGYLGRHRAKPGITGWAQINGCRGEIHSLEDMRRRIELDLYYIDHWSLWFDIRILLSTFFVFFRDEQAY